MEQKQNKTWIDYKFFRSWLDDLEHRTQTQQGIFNFFNFFSSSTPSHFYVQDFAFTEHMKVRGLMDELLRLGVIEYPLGINDGQK